MTTRTALVGFGWSGEKIWLPRLLANPGYDVVAAVDPDPARRAAFTAATGLPAFADPGELDADTTGLAVVAVPNHLHAPVAASLLRRGITTFVEKPVCLTVREADLLADAERHGGAPLLAGSPFRCRADVTALTKLVPELGRIREVELSWIRARGVPHARGWFTSRERAGGGVLLDLGWHLLDVLEDITGSVRFDQLAASASDDHVREAWWSAAWREDEPDPDGVADVEDTVRAFMVTGDGCSVGLLASWASHEAAHDVTTIRVAGSAGTATLRCTFGFSPHREPRSSITHVRMGTTTDVEVDTEPIGAEYDRQLADLLSELAVPRERAIDRSRRIITTIDEIYTAAASRMTAGATGGAR